MRLWTLHPRYLDAKGLVALWREALLAQAVLCGETRGYRRHPQLLRLLACPDPRGSIASYLTGVLEEARRRGYHFDAARIRHPAAVGLVEETTGQLLFEWRHLQQKLAVRNPATLAQWRELSVPDAHPLFRIVDGEVRLWEKGIQNRLQKAGQPRDLHDD
ncbi:MAG: DNA lyase [Magnetococcales bacterium]|nr:DNA lyase [Magnetococcales bacterium]